MKNVRKIDYVILATILLLCLSLFTPNRLIEINPSDISIQENRVKINTLPIFNYTMTLGAPYNWIDASGGEELLLSTDHWKEIVLPFSFSFYDQTFSKIYLCTNGYFSFTYQYPEEWNNLQFPLADPKFHYVIAPFWDDVRIAYAGGSGSIYVQSFGTYWVAEWLNVDHYHGYLLGSFELVLYENGSIIFNYDYLDYMDLDNGYTCGLNLGVDTNYYNSYQGLNDLTDDFSILFTYPDSLTVNTPDITSSWETDSSHPINWISTGSISDVKIELYENDIFVMEIVASIPNDGDFSWLIPTTLVDSTLYQIKISDVANPDTYDFSSYFEIFTPESIKVTIPNSLSVWETGTSQNITWTSTGTITNVKIELYKNGGFMLGIIASTSNDGSYTWDIPTDLNNSDQYRIKISDASYPSTYTFSDYFEIESPAEVGEEEEEEEEPSDGAIPGYSIYIVIGVVGLVSIILFKKRLKLIK